MRPLFHRIGFLGSVIAFSKSSDIIPCEEDSLSSHNLTFSAASVLHRKKKKESTSSPLVLVSGTCHPKLAKEISEILKVPLHSTDIARFADGEVKIELETVRGGSVFIIQPCGAPVSDSTMELLLATSAAKRAGAKSITAVIPYYPYKHRRFGLPKSSKYGSKFLMSAAMDYAKMLDEMGVDKILTVDLQRPGQGHEACFFDNSIPMENIVTTKLIGEYFLKNVTLEGDIVVVSPNEECLHKSIKYERLLSKAYSNSNISLAALVHHGTSTYNQGEGLEALGNFEVSFLLFICFFTFNPFMSSPQVNNCNVVIIDDFIDSAETISYIANRVHHAGAKRIFVIASHGTFSPRTMQVIDRSPIERVFVTNSLPLPSVRSDKVVQVSVANLIAQSIYTEQFASRKLNEDYEIEFH
jgi:ribose-phosphate pyrophosphokinase